MRCRQGLCDKVPIFLIIISWPNLLKNRNIKNLNGPGYNLIRNIIQGTLCTKVLIMLRRIHQSNSGPTGSDEDIQRWLLWAQNIDWFLRSVSLSLISFYIVPPWISPCLFNLLYEWWDNTKKWIRQWNISTFSFLTHLTMNCQPVLNYFFILNWQFMRWVKEKSDRPNPL